MAKYGLGLSISDGQTLTIAEGMALPITNGGTPTPDPVQPSGLSLSASGSTSIVLTFTGGAFDVYTVQYRAGTGSWLTYSSTVTTPSGARTVTISGLTASTTYQTRVANNATPGTYVTSSTVTTDAATPGTSCLWSSSQIVALAKTATDLVAAVAVLQSDVTAIKTTLTNLSIPTVAEIQNGLAKPGNAMGLLAATIANVKDGLATSQNVTDAKTAILEHLPETGRAATISEVAENITTETVNVTQQTVDLSPVTNKLPANGQTIAGVNDVKTTVNTQQVNVTQETVEVTQETVNVVQETVDLTVITDVLATLLTAFTLDPANSDETTTTLKPVALAETLAALPAAMWSDTDPDTPPRTITLTTVQLAAIGAAVLSAVPAGTEGRLTLGALTLAALNADSATVGGQEVLTVRKSDGSTFAQFPLRTEPAASAKIISGIGEQ